MTLATMLLCASLLSLAGCDDAGLGSDWDRLERPVSAPDFTLPQLDGGSVSLSDHRGRVVVMEFSATWRGPCRYSTPSLEVIYQRYRDRGVTVLLINEGETADRIRAWAKKRFTAPILLDQDERVGQHYEVEALPKLFIIDRAGRITYVHEGYGGGLERNLTLVLEELLAADASQPTT